ncbi:unnamed protein product [Effrenium voratum]|uniref:Sulfatase N-terminal domain-containing protein n=1 Tax=Effrenium voratum TaxID=2562239 RepID=A0AA36J3T3_9DINO|nr:unnamed protein product [Effrenium voratum]CAJ1434566.1 unnamed protein product [Effrenium voratum]
MALAAMQSVAALVLCGLTLCFAECQGDCEAEDTGLVQRPKYYNYGYYHKDYYHKYYSRRRRRERKKPNILIIIIDDLGFNQVGFRAKPEKNYDVKTPNIDALADEGIVMDRFYATPWCAPSRGAIQSGRLDVINPNVPNNVWNFDPNATYNDSAGEAQFAPYVGGIQPGTLTMGKRFAELGYVTHLNGKWGIGGASFLNTPMGMGYSSFLGWFGDSMESCDGAEPGFAVGGAGPFFDALPGFWRQDSQASFNASWCSLLKSAQLTEEEISVGCRSFKQELDDVADEMIRRRSREIITQHDYEKPLFLVHALQLMHLPMQYPKRFAPTVTNAREPLNEDLRAATYGALKYVDWVIGDLIDAVKEQDQYDNTLVFLTSDNGGAIYAGTANNNFPLRGGKFNNFDGGQRVNALFSGGWIEGALNHYDLKAFYSETVMAMNDVPETLLQMVTGRPFPDGGMRNKPGPLSGIPLWDKILQKRQVPRRITYSETMEIKVGPNIADLRKIWFTENNTIIADGNWSTNFPTNIEFIPDLAYLYVRPCGEPYCHFDLYSDSGEQSNIILSPAQEQRMRQDVFDAWNDNILDSARIKSLNGSNGLPFQVALWTYYGNSGPFVNLDAEPISVPAQCWCDWIDDGVAPEEVTHMIINLYLGIRCTNTIKAFGIAGALACERPLSLTQAPINFSLQENMWKTIGYETSNFSSILTAQWNEGPVELLFPLPLLEWNFAAIHGLQSMNARRGFENWANIEKYPFNLAIRDRCPQMEIFTAPTPRTQVTDWFISAGFFNNPTAGAGGNGRLAMVLEKLNFTLDNKVRGCFIVGEDAMQCPILDNKPPLVDPFDVPNRTFQDCLDNCILWDPDA